MGAKAGDLVLVFCLFVDQEVKVYILVCGNFKKHVAERCRAWEMAVCFMIHSIPS